MIMSNPLKNMHFKRGFIVAVLLLTGLFPLNADAFEILLGTEEAGTFSHFAGRTISRIINRHAEAITCRAVPAPDDIDNLTNLQDGSLDACLVDSRMLFDALNKKGNFEFFDISYDNLRIVIPLYNIPITLVVRKDAKIDSLDALKGKRINAGAPRSREHLAIDTIMEAKGWTDEDFRLFQELSSSHSQDTMAFCHGTIQAMLHIGVHPDSELEQLFKLCKADMVDMLDSDIEKLVHDHPAYLKIDIAANTYPFQTRTVSTFGTTMSLIVSDALDEKTVYEIMDAIYSNRGYLKGAHPALLSFEIADAGKNDINIKVHPGAAKYFSDHGL